MLDNLFFSPSTLMAFWPLVWTNEDLYAEFTVESFIFGQYLNSFPVGQTAVIADLGHGQPYLWELQLFSSHYLPSFINFGLSLVYTPGDITNNKQIWMVFKYICNHK